MNTVYVCRPPEGEEHLLDSQWTYLLKSFGIEEIANVDIGPETPVVVFQPRVGREVSGETSLTDFIHPDGDVVYLFGGSHSVMRTRELSDLNVIAYVYIPTSDDWNLFSPQAAAIVLWDRAAQHG